MVQFRKSLMFKLGIVIVVIQILGSATVGYLNIQQFSNEVEKRFIERMELISRLIEDETLDTQIISETELLEQLIGEDIEESFIVNPDGMIFLYSYNQANLGRSVNDLADQGIDPAWFKPDLQAPVVTRVALAEHDSLVAVIPIRGFDETIRFFLVVKTSTKSIAQEERDITNLIVVGSITTLAIILLAYFVSFNILVLNPIRQLTKLVTQIEQGDLAVRTPITPQQDEWHILQSGFNNMIQSLQTMVLELESRVAERTRDLNIAFEEAEKANQMKSQFLAMMSHELRTPLNSVINFVEFVLRGILGPVNTRQQEALATSVRSARLLLQLIDDILDISKIEAGLLNLFLQEKVDLELIFQEANQTALALLGDKPITFQLEIESPLPEISCDRKRVLQVILNMVSNACKFTKQGQITLKAQALDNNILISVEDTGPGIAKEDYKQVFEPFKQTMTGLQQNKGTGLGMPISKELVEAHGGKMWIESTVNQGSTFFVLLPCVPTVGAT